jgi:O-antigen ligase
VAALRDSAPSTRGRARDALLAVAAATVLVGPFVLAFYSGGFFDQPRIVAALVTWGVVAVVAVASPHPLPRDRRALTAVLGLALLAVWTAISLAWAPIVDAGMDDLQRLVLYAGALVAATALLRGRAARVLEPLTLLGTVVLLVYGMSDRLLPHDVFLKHYFSSGSRLEQPLTYWNAMGLVGAIGLVLAARLAADRSRPLALRILAAAAAAPLGAGLYLTFSRGALAALGTGLVVLLAVAPTWIQLRAIVLTLTAAAIPALVASRMPGVVNFDATESARDVQGFVLMGTLAVTMLAAGAAQAWACRAERGGTARVDRLPLPRRVGLLATGLVVLAAVVFVASAAKEQRSAATVPSGAETQRFGSLQSNRYQYWRVALDTFADHPVAGTGTAGFRVEWLRRRTIGEQAKDAHSLYLETAAELGLVGLALLGMTLVAVALAARRALRLAPAAAAGPVAVVALWAFHAGIDWDWEMPAVTLLGIAFAGALLALVDEGAAEPPPTPASRSD